MAVEVIMPKAGSEMEEGEIVQWFKQEGDEVKEGEILLEIVTDKVNMEVEAEASGTLLKILHPAGSVVPVVQTIAWIGQPGEAVPGGDSTTAAAQEIVKEVAADVKVPETNAGEVAPKRERRGEYDVVVVGGGPAGYVSAIKAAQLGGKVALVENRELGGTCLNRGCIPTKTFLHNAEIINHIRSAKDRGIKLVNDAFSVDMEQTVAVKNKISKTLSGGIAGLLKSYGVKVFNGVGQLTADKKVVVKHALKYSKLKDNQVSISPKYIITHTILSWRKSFCILGECCSKKINASKSAVIHHSPRDKVFRLPKVGHVLSSLLRTTYTLHIK